MSAPRTVHGLLASRAHEFPDRVFLRFAEHEYTYAEVDAKSEQLARGLRDLGVKRGDLVPSLLPNRPESCFLWFALNRLGAVHAPVNTAFRASGLAHVLNLTKARVVVVDESLLVAVTDVWHDLINTPKVVVTGVDTAVGSGQVAFLELMAAATSSAPLSHVDVPELETSLLLFTSGTTGRSKACALPHRFAVRQAELMSAKLRLREDDVLYSPFPLFHADAAIFTVMPALALGATAAVGVRFSTAGFWDEVRQFEATVFDFMGATLTLLAKHPPREDDSDNPARLAWGVPLPAFASEFEERFGLTLIEVYGLTDVGIVLYNSPDEPRRVGSCGRAIPEFEVQILDADGNEAPRGAVGEIAVRPNEPGLIMNCYHGMPEATVETFRDLWFHTGDLATMDPDGRVFFVGRTKDVIRRFGENISAFEVEEVALSHPSILDAAAFAVPSELSEDELMLAVVPRTDARPISAAELAAYFEGRIASYAIPRFIELLDRLPRTPTEKVEKHLLATRGVTPHTWDRRTASQSPIGPA